MGLQQSGVQQSGVQHNEQDDEMHCPALSPVRDATEMTISTGPDIITIRPRGKLSETRGKHYLKKLIVMTIFLAVQAKQMIAN